MLQCRTGTRSFVETDGWQGVVIRSFKVNFIYHSAYMPLPSIQPFMSCAFRFEANPVNASQLIPVIVGSLPLGSLRCSVMSSSLEWFIPTFGLFGGHQWHVIHHIISHLLSFIVHHFLGMCSPQLQLVDCQHHT